MEIRKYLIEGIWSCTLLAGVIGCFVAFGIAQKKEEIAMRKASEIEAIVEKTEFFPEEGFFDKHPKRPSPNNFVGSRGMSAGFAWYQIGSRVPASAYLTIRLPDDSKRIFEYWGTGHNASIANNIANGYKSGDKVRFKETRYGFILPPVPKLSKK